jgi:hypothetical protein
MPELLKAGQMHAGIGERRLLLYIKELYTTDEKAP